MRLHPPTTILTSLVAVFALMIAMKGPTNGVTPVECKVASDFIDAILEDGEWLKGTKDVLLTEGDNRGTELRQFVESDKALPSDRVNPLLPFYSEMEKRQEEHLADVCPKIIERFPRISKDSPEVKTTTDEDGNYSVIFFGMNVPAVSEKAGLALISGNFVYAGLDGQGIEALMMKDKGGKWRIAHLNTTWIS